jgi:hypothetical protein
VSCRVCGLICVPIVLKERCSRLPHNFTHGPLGSLYQTSQTSTCVEKHTVIKVRHCTQSLMLLLCAPHHLAGVSLRASSIANSLCCIGTLSSKSDKKVSKGFRPSKVGKLLTVVPIQRTSLVSLAHLLVDNSYILFCQFSSSYSESDEHTLSLH